MKNPYKILGVPMNADKKQIAEAMKLAMRSRKYSLKDITEAQTTLRKPASRLAADFTFPILDRGEIKTLVSNISSDELNLDEIDENKYDSIN